MSDPEATRPNLSTLVDHMFDRVLEAPERAQLLSWIEAWEADNPDVDNAHRVTGWIDVAYSFQAQLDRDAEIHARVHTARWTIPTFTIPNWTGAPATA